MTSLFNSQISSANVNIFSGKLNIFVQAGAAKLLYIPLPVDALHAVLEELKASGIRQGIL